MFKIPDKLIEFILNHLTIYTLMLNLLLTICLYLLTPTWLSAWLQAHSGSLPAWLLQLLLSLGISFFVIEVLTLPAKMARQQKCKKIINNLSADEMAVLMQMAQWGFKNYPLPNDDEAVLSLQAKSIIQFNRPAPYDFSEFTVNKAYLPFIKQKMLQAKD